MAKKTSIPEAVEERKKKFRKAVEYFLNSNLPANVAAYIREIIAGMNAYRNAQTPEQKKEAAIRIYKALKFKAYAHPEYRKLAAEIRSHLDDLSNGKLLLL